MAKLRLEKGNYDSSLSFLDRAYELITKHNLLEHTVHADYLYYIACIESMKGAHGKVIDYLDLAMQVQNNATGKEHLHYVKCLAKLIKCFALQGAFEAAFQKIEEASGILRQIIEPLNPRHPMIWTILGAKGITFYYKNQRTEAKEFLEKSLNLNQYCYRDEQHPAMLEVLLYFGKLYTEMHDNKQALAMISRGLMTHQRYFLAEDNPSEVNQLIYYQTYFQFAQLSIGCKRGVYDEYDVKSVEERFKGFLTQLEKVNEQIRSEGGGSVLEAEIYLAYAKYLMMLGRFPEARTYIGKSGAEMKRYFQRHDAPLMYRPLMALGEFMMEQDKNREAKILFSYCMLHIQLLLGPKTPNHILIVETFLLSIENMRRLGYFHDAVEALAVVREKITKGFGPDSVEMCNLDYLDTCVLRDRQKHTKAEIIFADLDKKFSEYYSKVSVHYFRYKHAIAKCYLMQGKTTLAFNFLSEATEIANRFNFGNFNKVPCILELKSDMEFVHVTSNKPNDLNSALKVFKDTLLPDITRVYGKEHSYTLHTKGRLALFMNGLQKGSGRKQIYEILRTFDEMKPYPLPFDHPYITELGGYEKASSKDRLSRHITEMALYPWSELEAEDYYDPNSSAVIDKYSPLIPKAIFVDMKNSDPQQWGVIHFYGTDLASTANHHSDGSKRGRSKNRGAERSRSPSPSNAASTSVKGKGSGPSVSDLEEQLKQEVKARKAAEDNVVQLKYDKHNLEESLEAEKTTVLQLNKQMDEQKELNKMMENKVIEIAKQMEELQAKLTAVENELQEKIRREEEEAARRRAEQELAEAEARLRAERLSQVEGEIVVPSEVDIAPVVVSFTPEELKDLEAAEFLLKRAIRFHEDGWYRKAAPLFDEAFVIRQRILGIQKMGTLDIIRWQAVNHRCIGNFHKSQEQFLTCLSAIEGVFGKENDPYLLAKVDSIHNSFDQGFYVQAKEELDHIVKSIASKIQLLELESKRWSTILAAAERKNKTVSNDAVSATTAETGEEKIEFTPEQAQQASVSNAAVSSQIRNLSIMHGRVLTYQAMVALEEGNFNEAKALIERGQAILSKALGLNHLYVVQALLVKVKIFLVLVRPKEAISILEQAFMIVKILGKLNREAELKEEQQKSSNQKPEDEKKQEVSDYDHPLLADIYILWARAMLAQCFYTDAVKKLIHARSIRTKYFEVPELAYRDIRILEVEYYEAIIQATSCEFLKAQEGFIKILGDLTVSLATCLNEENPIKFPLYLGLYHQLALVHVRVGDYISAKEYLSLLTKQMKLLGIPNNILTYDFVVIQIVISHLTGDFYTKDIIENEIEKMKNSLHKEHPLLLHMIIKQAEYYDHSNETDVAEKYYERSIKYLKANCPHGHELSLEAMVKIVLIKLRCGQPIEARKALKELQRTAQAVFGYAVDHEIFAYIFALEGKILLYEMENADALKEPVVTKSVDPGIVEVGEAIDSANHPSSEAKETDAFNQEVEEILEATSQRKGEPVAEGVHHDQSFPEFDNQTFLKISEQYETCLDRLNLLFAKRNRTSEPSAMSATMKASEVPTNASLPGPPFMIYIKGLLGQIKLKEYVAQQQFIQTLSTSQREMYFLQQQEKEKKSGKGQRQGGGKVGNSNSLQPADPPGKKDIEQAIDRLRNWSFMKQDHSYILELQDILQELVLQFDDLQIATMNYQKALKLKNIGKFTFADKLFDEAFILLFRTIGGNSSSCSLLMAQLLYEKAENSRQLARKTEYVKSLHLLAIRIYKQYKEDENRFDYFVAKNLFAMICLLVDQHAFEDALGMLSQFQSSLVSSYPLFDSFVDEALAPRQKQLQVTLTKASSSDSDEGTDIRDSFLLFILVKIYQAKLSIQLYRYDEALAFDAKAMEMIKLVTIADHTPTIGENEENSLPQTDPILAEYLIRVYLNELHINDQLGHFAVSEEFVGQIQKILNTWKKQVLLASAPTANSIGSSAATVASTNTNIVVGTELDTANYKILLSDIFHQFAEHSNTLHKFTDGQQWLHQSLEIRMSMFNRIKMKPPVAEGESVSTSKKSSKFNPNEEPEWTKEKQQEVRSSFLAAIDILINAGNDPNGMKDTTDEPDVVRSNKRGTSSGGEGGELENEMQSASQEILNDFDSTRNGDDDSGSHADEDRDEKSVKSKNSEVTNAQTVGISLMDFMLPDEKVFVFQQNKITAHVAFIDSLYLQGRLSLALGDVGLTKESIDIAQQMAMSLYTRLTIYKLKLQFIHAKLRFLQNQVEESKNLHMKILEQRLSLASSTILVNLDISESYAVLSDLHVVLGQYEDAMQFINDALKIERKLFHKYHKSLSFNAATMSGTALGLAAANNASKDSHYRIQSLLIVCADILYYKGYYQDSNSLLDSCLTIQKNNLNALNTNLHLSIVHGMITKARNNLELGKCEDAITLLQHAKSMTIVILGERHFAVGLIYYYLSQVMRVMGKLLDCKTQLDLAVTTIRSQLGKYHFYTIFTLLDIGVNFMDLGKFVTAQHVLQRANHLIKKSLGKDHIMLAVGQNAMGELHIKMGLLDKVNPYFDESLYITRKAIGSDRFPLIATIMGNINEVKSIRGIFDECIQGLDDTIALMKIIYGTPNHYSIAKVTLTLANTFLAMGKIHEAKSQFDKVYIMTKSLSSSDHVLLYESQFGVAQCLLCIGRVDQSKALFERCLNSFKDWKGSNHPTVAAVLNKLGDIYNLLQRLAQAESLLIESYTIRMKTYKECNANHIELAKNLLSFAENLRLRGLFLAPPEKDNRDEDDDESSKNHRKGSSKGSSNKKLLISDTLKLKTAGMETSSSGSGKMKNIKEEENEVKEELDEVDAILSQADKEDPDLVEEKKRKRSKIVIDSDSITTDAGPPLVNKMLVSSVDNPSTLQGGTALGEGGMSSILAPQPSASQNMDTAVNVGPSHTMSQVAESNEGPATSEKVRDDDEESAPTVMISAIEHLDREVKRPKEEGIAEEEGDDDEATLPGGIASEIRHFLQDEQQYRSMPLLERAMTDFLVFFQDDQLHPFVFTTRHIMAENYRGLGDFEKALSMHEQLFQSRRKILGDQHYDTITSLLSIAEVLRVMKRVFPSNQSKPMHTSAHGSSSGGLASGAAGTNIGAGGVSLLDHLTSLMIPVKAPARPKTSAANSFEDDEDGNLFGETEEEKLRRVRKKNYETGKDWIFLTKSDFDKDTNKKHKPLPIPRGYMGYQFPPVKRDNPLDESTGNMLQAINSSTANANNSGATAGASGGNANNPLHDPKKCIDLTIMLLKKALASDEYGITLKKNEMFDHPYIASCLYIKAEIARLRGDGIQALKFLEQALAMRRRLFRAHHPGVADCLFSMAELLRQDQRYAQALPIYDKALEIRIETYGAVHFSCAEIENSTALLHIAQGNYTKAQELLVHALDLCELTLGPEHPSTAFACNNHAALLQAMGKFKEALAWYRKALQIKQKIYGDLHPEIATTMNNMGLLYKTQGKYDEAMVCYEKALTIQKQILGTNHPDIASTLNNFAAILSIQEGRKFEAKEYFKQSLGIRSFCYGSENALVASTMNNYAGLLYSLGEITHAQEMFEESLRIRRKLLGDEHPAVAESLHNLGYFYFAQQQTYESKIYYEEALKIRKKLFGPEHLLVATTCLHFSNVLAQMNEWPIGVEIAQEAYRIREKAFGDLHEDVIAAKKSLERIEKKYQRFLRLNPPAPPTAGPGKKTTSNSQTRVGSAATSQRPKAAKDLPPRTASPNTERPNLGFEVAGAGSLTLGEHNME